MERVAIRVIKADNTIEKMFMMPFNPNADHKLQLAEILRERGYYVPFQSTTSVDGLEIEAKATMTNQKSEVVAVVLAYKR